MGKGGTFTHNNMGLAVPLSSKLSVTCMALRLVLQMQDHTKLNKQFGSSSRGESFSETTSQIFICIQITWGAFPGRSVVMNPPANAEYTGSIPGSERSPGEGNGNPLHYSCLGNYVDRGAWQATVHGVKKSWV